MCENYKRSTVNFSHFSGPAKSTQTTRVLLPWVHLSIFMIKIRFEVGKKSQSLKFNKMYVRFFCSLPAVYFYENCITQTGYIHRK